MKRMKIVALVMVCVLVLTGCSLFSPDEERIANQVVATVNGVEIYRYEVDQEMDVYAMQNGIDLDSEDPMVAFQVELQRSQVLERLTISEVMLQKAPELGIVLTEEVKAQNKEQVDSLREMIRETVEEEAKEDASIDVEAEVQIRYAEYEEMRGITDEEYLAYLNEQSIISDVTDYILSFAEVADQEVKDWYDSNIETQKTEMEEDPLAFDSYVADERVTAYVPEDMVAVKHVLLKFEDEELVSEAQTLYQEGNADEAMALLDGEIEKLMPDALAVKQRLEDGENIDDVIAELGEDTGMTQGIASRLGYLVGESTQIYLPEFSEAALGLTEVGAISEPVATYYGLHVMQCVALYEQGAMPFEDIEALIHEQLLPSKEQQKYSEMAYQWMEEEDVELFMDRLK